MIYSIINHKITVRLFIIRDPISKARSTPSVDKAGQMQEPSDLLLHYLIILKRI
jgi:hypothetical protein